ncbi:non-ribosomal peptide synthetase [Algibacillus agarilyticus]|uniref:non-ribosomal peptide synthetase n=1 Tax=Algibacillus agarilyticus TaxID=2234133 RepID=UPI000DD0E47A|nr:non-ribosomal peptide synthetase [Algibacillus agarilyticus]
MTQSTTTQYQQLTDAQAGIWFAQLRSPENPIYKTGEYIVIEGTVNTDSLDQAISQAINEVDSLNAQFITTTEGPRMLVNRQPWQVDHIDFSTEKLPLKKAVSWMQKELKNPVNLETGPLFSMAIIKLAADQFVWFLSLHHIAIDGYSMSLIASRVSHIYTQLTSDSPIDKANIVSQQALIAEDEDYKTSDKYQADRNFYLERFADHNDTINLAGKPTITSDHFWRLKGALPAADFSQMASVAKLCRTHWYSVLIASIASYVHRMTRSNNVVLGVPLMGRLGSVAIQTPAMRVNILPVRVEFNAGDSLIDLIKQVNKEFAAVRRHQGYRYEELHRELNVVKDNRNLFGPLVNIMPFNYEHQFGDLPSKAFNLSAGPVDDMSIYCYELDGLLHLDIDANPELYSEAELAEHQQRLFNFMSDFFTKAQQSHYKAARDEGNSNEYSGEHTYKVKDINILFKEETQKILHDWNNTDHPVKTTTLAQLLHQQALATPNQAALIFEQHQLTYAQLHEKVQRLAYQFIEQGINKGDTIAVIIPRSLELIIAQQAIMLIGAIYLPVDPDYPDGRIAYMLDSSAPKLTLCTAQLALKVPSHNTINLVDGEIFKQWVNTPAIGVTALVNLRISTIQPHDPAYIIYTSGSTGKPKGVVINHQAIVNRLMWMQAEYPIDQTDKILQKTPAGFDVSVWEFFWPLITGATLVVAKPDGHKDPLYLAEIIQQQNITTLHFVPSMLQVFIAQATAEQTKSLRQVFCSGEALPIDLVKNYYQLHQAPLHNLYGPTEAAIDVTYWPCSINDKKIPIGKPVWNTQIYILDPNLQLVPPGVIGELYIGGVQLADGYYGQAELTAERFIANPFKQDGSRLYQSGDLARWDQYGAIEYIGRSDFQVKIRGFRIELEEIENALALHPEVAQVSVLAQEYTAGDKRLVAYIKPTHTHKQPKEHHTGAENNAAGNNIDVGALQAFLATLLPEYMIPSYFVEVAEFPLTANGKLDRKALPKPDLSGQIGNKGPANLVEERLCKLFCQLLDIPEVGTSDNFFELGGHSLLAAQLIAYVKEIMGVELSLAAVFESPTVEGIANKLNGSSSDEALNILLPLRKRENQPAVFCVHPAGGLSWCYAALTPIIPSYIPIYGVQSKNLASPDLPLPSSMRQMAEEYVAAIRAEQPFGPYHLLGWSIGGMIAHHMAAVLQQQGQEVGLLTILDSYPTEQWQQMNPPQEDEALGALIRMAGVEFDESAHSSLTRPQVIDILQEAGSSMAHLSADTISAMIEVVINNNSRVRDEVDYVYQGDMLFFNAVKPPEEAFLDREGWHKYMQGNIDVVEVDCIHRDMMQPDMLRLIGRHMAERLTSTFTE